MPTSLLTNPKPGDAFVYVSTIQRMSINLFGKRPALSADDDESGRRRRRDQLNIPIHAFDLIIADECHRGYTAQEISTWRDTLNYFDAVTIGLTATPAAHTMAQFEHVVYRYEYERAVREGNLVDYDAVRIKSDVRINGVFLQPGDQIDNVDPETGTTRARRPGRRARLRGRRHRAEDQRARLQPAASWQRSSGTPTSTSASMAASPRP